VEIDAAIPHSGAQEAARMGAVALKAQLKRALPGPIAALAVALALGALARYLPYLLETPEQIDLAAYYLAARVLGAGGNPYVQAQLAAAAAQAGVARFTPYTYLPLFATLLRPLAAQPYDQAATLWYGANLVLAALGAALLARALGYAWRATVLILLGAFILPATAGTLLLGQLGLALNLLFVGLLALSAPPERPRRADVLAGVLLGLAIAAKIYPGVLALVYLLHRRWTTLLASVATVLAALAACALTSGMPSLAQWATRVPSIVSIADLYPANQSLDAVAARLFPGAEYIIRVATPGGQQALHLVPFLGIAALRVVVPVVGIAGLLAASALALRRLARVGTAQAFALSLALGLATMLLVWPVSWDVHFVHLLMPLVVLARLRGASWGYRMLLATAALCLGLQAHWEQIFPYLASPLLMMFGFLAGIGVWAGLVRSALERA
jgi:hypothetical protein